MADISKISVNNTVYDVKDSTVRTLEAEDRAALVQQVDGGAKNLLNPLYLTAASVAGVTITENGDGTYSLSGTATGIADYLHTPSDAVTNMLSLKRGEKYCISTGLSKVKIRVDYSTNGTSWDNGGGSGLVMNEQGYGEFTVPSNAAGMYIRFRSTAADGSLDGETLYPMLCTASDYAISPAFVPYRPSWQEMYDMIKALQDGA